MKTFFLLLHILVSAVLVGLVLIQSSQGGLGSAFGSTGTYRNKRGAERIIHIATIVTAGLFLAIAIVNLAL